MIYKTEDGYVISSQKVWKPGVYQDRRSATYAFRFDDEVLSELTARINVNERRNITFEDLRENKHKN